MSVLLNNLLGKPTLANVVISSIWIQVAGLSAVAILEAPNNDPLEEPDSVEVHVQFSGAKQVESLESTPAEIPPAQPDETEADESEEDLPIFEPVRADADRPDQEADSEQLLAKADLFRQPAVTELPKPSRFAKLATTQEPPSPQLQLSDTTSAPELQPRRSTTSKTVPRKRPKTIVDFRPSVAAVSLPSFAGTDDRQPARFPNNRPPAYPAEAYRAGIEGEVLLKLYVSETGQVERVEISRSSGHRILDEAARDAVGTWRGAPAYKNGRAVATVEHLPVRFRLRLN